MDQEIILFTLQLTLEGCPEIIGCANVLDMVRIGDPRQCPCVSPDTTSGFEQALKPYCLGQEVEATV